MSDPKIMYNMSANIRYFESVELIQSIMKKFTAESATLVMKSIVCTADISMAAITCEFSDYFDEHICLNSRVVLERIAYLHSTSHSS